MSCLAKNILVCFILIFFVLQICHAYVCGDGICEKDNGEKGRCCEDCGCPEDMICDTESHLCISACGNHICDKDECSLCPKDCSVENCTGNGVCDIAVGENCRNAAIDCKCSAKIEFSEPVYTLIEETSGDISVDIFNTGNMPEVFRVYVYGDFEIEWTNRSVRVDPDASVPLSIHVIAPDLHFPDFKDHYFNITLRVTSEQTGDSYEANVTLVSKFKGWYNWMNEDTFIGTILDIKDYFEYFIYGGALIYVLKSFFIKTEPAKDKKKKVKKKKKKKSAKKVKNKTSEASFARTTYQQQWQGMYNQYYGYYQYPQNWQRRQ